MVESLDQLLKSLSLKSESKSTGETPYQGDGRCYGYFKCTSCGRNWESGNSWKNTFQMCKRCNLKIFPYKQTELLKPKLGEERKVDVNKNHEQSLCGKCKELGRLCRPKLYGGGYRRY